MTKNKIFMTSIKVIPYLFMCCSILNCTNLYAQELTDKSRANADTILYVRKNTASPEAFADLKALEKAIGIMKSSPCDSPLSWYYQGAMHSIPDTILNGNPLCPGVITIRDTLAGWHSCPHYGEEEINFLTWHRLFIWHFEKIIRKLSGKKDFALPYWDYTNPETRMLPAIFRDSSSPLFEPARQEGLNRGKTIEHDLNNSLLTTNPDSMRLYQLFNHSLNQSPHSPIHLVVGGWNSDSALIKNMWNEIYQKNTTGLMWEFQSAAFDPIFWVHHSNVDYLWHRWELSVNGALPIPDSLKAHPWPYIFFDENDGHRIVYSMEEVASKINSLDYVYDVLINKTMHAEARTASHPVILAEAAVAKVVTSINFAFAIRIPATPVQMANRITPKRKQLFILEVTATYKQQPIGIYELYLEKGGKSLPLGFLTFLGAHHHGKKPLDQMQDMKNMDRIDEEEERIFQFDLSQKFNFSGFNGNLHFRLLRQGGRSSEIAIKKMILKSMKL